MPAAGLAPRATRTRSSSARRPRSGSRRGGGRHRPRLDHSAVGWGIPPNRRDNARVSDDVGLTWRDASPSERLGKGCITIAALLFALVGIWLGSAIFGMLGDWNELHSRSLVIMGTASNCTSGKYGTDCTIAYTVGGREYSIHGSVHRSAESTGIPVHYAPDDPARAEAENDYSLPWFAVYGLAALPLIAIAAGLWAVWYAATHRVTGRFASRRDGVPAAE